MIEVFKEVDRLERKIEKCRRFVRSMRKAVDAIEKAIELASDRVVSPDVLELMKECYDELDSKTFDAFMNNKKSKDEIDAIFERLGNEHYCLSMNVVDVNLAKNAYYYF